MVEKIRQPQAAGNFYPAKKEELKKEIIKNLNLVARSGASSLVRAIIVPHAGYYYSGTTAAAGYKKLEEREIRTVFLLCNSHVKYFDGIAVDDSDAWQTPLGLVPVDREKVKKLSLFDAQIKLDSQAHLYDHTIEVQLPFLQTVLKNNFKIVPILFGNINDLGYEKLTQALVEIFSADDLLVVSTDLSHYPTKDSAALIDQKTLELIMQGDVLALDEHVKQTEEQEIPGMQTLLCGIDGVKTAMVLSRKLGWQEPEILSRSTSGDISGGDVARVVGYGAVIYYQNEKNISREINRSILSSEQKEKLVKLAREAVENFIKYGKIMNFSNSDERLDWRQGAFVTLHKQGQLRGCIGQIAPNGSALWQVVRDMAIAAAINDHRFFPVEEKELIQLEYEISALSIPEKINNWRLIELGKHGVIVKKGFHTGVFLPQVATETNWTLEEFLDHLCEDKAGLPAGCYRDDPAVELLIFTAQVFQ